MTTTTLHDHRLTSIKLFRVTSHYPRTIGRNSIIGSHGSGSEDLAVWVETNAGATGWGLLALSGSYIERLLGTGFGEFFQGAGDDLDRALKGWRDRVQNDLPRRFLASAEKIIGRRLGDLFQPEIGVIDDAALPLDVALHDLAG